jgi:hypothetical protein
MPTKLCLRGILYDVGSNYEPGHLTREVWHEAGAARDMAVIARDLQCNAVTLFGTDLDRLEAGARMALREGLEVWLQPRLIDGTGAEVVMHLAETAILAELLRQGAPGRVTLNVGCELSLFMQGILPGVTFGERMGSLSGGEASSPETARRLNDALRDLLATARIRFAGPVVYSAGDWEDVDWAPFDLIGLDCYLDAHNVTTYEATLRAKASLGKPVVVTEFGCCCFEGTDALGAAGMMVISDDDPPRLKSGLVRDEAVQADYLRRSVAAFERSGVHGAFAYGFSEPGNLHTDDPLTDVDLASFGIVAETAPAKAGCMETWRPKLGFEALRGLYASS